MTPVTDLSALPVVLQRADLCRLFRICERTLDRWQHSGRFPVPEIATMPNRWWRDEVLAWMRPQESVKYFGHARRVASR